RAGVDGARAIEEQGNREAGCEGVKHARLDAVVGRQAADEELPESARLQFGGEVALPKGRVALAFGGGRLLDHEVDPVAPQFRVQLGAGSAAHAVARPVTAAVLEG